MITRWLRRRIRAVKATQPSTYRCSRYTTSAALTQRQNRLRRLAQPPHARATIRFGTRDTFRLKPDMGQFIIDEFVAHAPQHRVLDREAQAGVVFMGDQFGDD
jgi:hypothetical protein